MNQYIHNRYLERRVLSVFSVLFLLLANAPAQANDVQDSFSSPEKAVDSLLFATRNNHTTELLKILGPGSDKLVYSGDDVADQTAREKFAAAYDKMHKIEDASEGRFVLTVGDENWPMPIPLVHGKDGWRFDTKAGETEILDRRIGRNELSVIEVCRAYVEAQRDFVADNPQHEYAQNFQSSDDKHDGLYWSAKEGEKESPLGPLIAQATAEGYSETTTLDKRVPYHGYYYKILKQQGSHAASGAKDYMAKNQMTAGFALIAFPATYGDSGVMSFIVNQNGIVYEKNLGPQTSDIAARITAYDPDESWHIVR